MKKKPTYEELEIRIQALEKTTCDVAAIEAQLIKLSHAVEQSPTAIMVTDSDGVIEYVNPRFTMITGYTAEEVTGTSASRLGSQTEEEERNMWKTIRAGHVWRGEFLNRKKDGSHYWEKASISSILNKDKDITHFVKVSEDITELKESQKALRQSEEQRFQDQQRLAVLSFANEVSLTLMDELRNPLVAIGGFAHRIAGKDCSRERALEYGKIIFQQSKKLDDALNRVLEHLKGVSEKT